MLLLIPVMNVIAFALMGADKMLAKAGRRRIPEKTLFAVAALFGGLGGTAGMFFFRHKTRHRTFRVGFPALAVIQAVLVAAMLR